MDFGIASLTGASALTATGEVVGTLAYMAPEQAEGEVAGEAADVYSLALTLYECWAGANPVARATPAHTAGRSVERSRASRLPPGAPREPHRVRGRLPAPGAGGASPAGGASLPSRSRASVAERGAPRTRRAAIGRAQRPAACLDARLPARGADRVGPGGHPGGGSARAARTSSDPRRAHRTGHPGCLPPCLGPPPGPRAFARCPVARPAIPGRRRVSWGDARARRAGGARLVLAPGRGARSGWGLASASSTRLRTAGAAPRPRPPARCCRRCWRRRRCSGRSCSRWPR